MRVANHIVEKRRQELARLLARQRYLPVADICRRLGISEATARRDLASLEREQRIQRTFGGAVSFFNERFPSFQQRLDKNQRAKRLLARRALNLLRPGMVCFLDTGTTTYHLAEQIRDSPVVPLVVVTASLPVAELLAEVEGIEVHLLGGQLVVRQSVLLGPAARAALGIWKFDLAILSAEGMDERGLWNSQAEIVLLQQEVIRRAKKSVAILDGSKLGRSTPHQLVAWPDSVQLLSEAPNRKLLAAGIPAESILS